MHVPTTLAVSAIVLSLNFSEDPSVAPVFVPTQDGFISIRIPSIVGTKKGVPLAFAEGRAANRDQAKNKIILKRSLDGGKSWGDLSIVDDGGDRSLNNPCCVMEQMTGRVMLMYQSYPAGVRERSGEIQAGYEGENIVRTYVRFTLDWLTDGNDKSGGNQHR